MKDFFSSKFQNLKEKCVDACSCVKSNPCANLSSDLNRILSSVNSLDKGMITGALQSNYSQSIDKISNELKIIIGCVDSIFSKAEELYLSLDEHLNILEKLNKEYKRKANEPAVVESKITFTFSKEQAKEEAEKEKKRMLNNMEKICIDEQNIIDKIVSSLSSINDMNIDKKSISLVNSFNGYRISEDITDYSLYMKRRIVYDLYDKLTNKIDIEKMGFTREQVIDEMLNYPSLYDLDCKVEKILNNCPSNFNDTLAGVHEFTGDLKSYCFKKSYDELKSTRYIETGIVNIGGYDFEIIDVYGRDAMDFFTVLDKKMCRAYAINTIASYPKNMLQAVGTKGKDGSITPIVLDYDITSDVSGGIKGAYFYDKKSTIHVQYNSGTGLHTFNHELGHKFNDYFIDGKPNGSYVTRKYKNELTEIFNEEYMKVTCVDERPSYKYNQHYLGEDKLSEMFSECTDAYIRYGDELKLVAPKTYAFFHNIMGDKAIIPIKINGVDVPNDTAITKSIIWGH